MNDTILDTVRATAKGYGSVPFWSWNDRLHPEELRRQIRAMKKMGMNGFFMHARGGLETEYLSDDWFRCIEACVDEAKKQDMDAWSYDENGWPSGFAGGILLQDEDNFARYIQGEVSDTCDFGENVLGIYKIEDNVCRPASVDDEKGPFYIVKEGYDSSYVDVLRADVIAKFIEATHEEYKRRLGADFGHAMPGFFTDEPQYYRYASPYSRKLAGEFLKRFGYGLYDVLPAVFWDFEGAEKYRYDYYTLLHELYMKNYAKQIYDWCEANGCQQTGHGIAEESLAGQMMCCAGVMPFYQYEHVPGIDYLGRHMQTDMGPKQLGSACAQLGRKKALTETFACCGWDVSPRELKQIAEMQYAGGVNLMCQHLYPYSERGQRKRDYPCHYSEHSPWYDKMGDFDRHFANLGALLGAGEEAASVLVIHPIRDAYRTYKRRESGSVARQDEDIRTLMAALGHRQIAYHFGDEGMMETMAEVQGNKIRVGLCTYDTVIVPKMKTLTANTVRLLRKFVANGGKIHFDGDVPTQIDAVDADLSDLASNIDFDAIVAAADVTVRKNGQHLPCLRQRIRVLDGQRIIFTTNITNEDHYGIRLTIRNCSGAVGVSTDTLETYPLAGEKNADGSLTVIVNFPGSHSCVILEKPEADMLPIPTEFGKAPAMAIPEMWTLCAPLKNTLTLDRVSLSKDGGVTWTEARPIERVRDELLRERYEGDVSLRYAFTITDVPATAEIVWENPGVIRAEINSHEIKADGYLAPDPYFSRADVASLLTAGENALVLHYHYHQPQLVYDVLFGNVMESLRNCLCFETELECAYLRGDFRIGVEADKCTDGPRSSIEYTGTFPVIAPRKEIGVRDMVRDGLPFYGGAVEAECVIRYAAGDPTVFRPEGRFAAVDVWVNEAYAGMVFFDNDIDLSAYLREGENTLRIRIVNALRNTAGPHHRADPEPYGLSPQTFSFEKEWKDGQCAGYLDRYAFVKYGI